MVLFSLPKLRISFFTYLVLIVHGNLPSRTLIDTSTRDLFFRTSSLVARVRQCSSGTVHLEVVINEISSRKQH
ncbi:hypothetical protein BDV96DRAFT_563231 [Lophiotrema nucula]|uniref:Uncharacterized protein n=1 Tax=Lophiotrema nucula TaxID=690887 RepID=A0A6A5ZRG6_9PLEO|nr:hypothetical protein BDV96DRAFT_563231 [Lophiotrema nucula]